MAKHKRKRKHGIKFLLVVSSIIMLSAMGVSYGYWNDSLDITTSVTTGDIDADFCEDKYNIDVKQGEGDIDIEFLDDNTMEITGEVSHDFRALLYYCVENNGDIPIKFVEELVDNNNISVNHQRRILSPNNKMYNYNGNPKMEINVKKLEEDELNFRAILKFSQWAK